MLYLPHVLSIRFKIPPFLSLSAAYFIAVMFHVPLPSAMRAALHLPSSSVRL